MDERLIVSGFGGQGILFLGKLWAELMMRLGYEVTFFPSYGAEVRGGTCNCSIIASDDEIAMPVIDEPRSLMIMNQPSMERFAGRLVPGGIAVVNSSMVEPADLPPDRVVCAPPATEMAETLGETRSANMVMLGVYNAAMGVVDFSEIEGHIERSLSEGKKHLLEINLNALREGRRWFEEHGDNS